MDVSHWTLNSRMKLPDWCFGNRFVVGCRAANTNPLDSTWAISNLTLPDPACIWQIELVSQPTGGGSAWIRIGLAHAIPTSRAEMDAAVEILPDVGTDNAGPNLIIFMLPDYVSRVFYLRQGMVTGGKKLVIENRTGQPVSRVQCNMVVSGVPTKIPAWPGAWPAG